MTMLNVPYAIDTDKLTCLYPDTRNGEIGGVLVGISGGAGHWLFIPGDYQQLANVVSEGFKKAGKEVVEAERDMGEGYNGYKIIIPSENISQLMDFGHTSHAVVMTKRQTLGLATTNSVDSILAQIESPERRAAIGVIGKSPELAA